MDKALLDSAIKALHIQAVYLRDASVALKQDFIPQYNDGLALTPQYRAASVGKFAEIDARHSENHALKTVVFNYSAGVRLVDDQREPAKTEQPDAGQDFVYFELTALFSAHYRLDGEADEQALEEFARYNVGYHVWPYWREYVQNTCARLGLPVIPVPMYQLPE
jgi:hypothetical protein